MPRPFRHAALLAFALTASGAYAQSPDAPLKGRDTSPNIPPSTETVPEKVRPSEEGTGGSTLSDKLEKNDGVITPPGNSAPGLVVKPPESENSGMPVIKPGQLPGREPGTEAR
ncbi:hypothetical protein IPV08_09240 [Methylobacterium sp. SD274]|uniref:hypothetical protein n=1 Tax=Methylobacterium sp. SD274 TaxID=2782009 RepID=UPI001A95E46D|nr:hypothetical protein [Methylobacterium sp. SD274]MBO1020147.1 hypothetical protein [Methylobacterium sp. SD274]